MLLERNRPNILKYIYTIHITNFVEFIIEMQLNDFFFISHSVFGIYWDLTNLDGCGEITVLEMQLNDWLMIESNMGCEHWIIALKKLFSYSK